jgi:hypothetical protein
MVRVGALGHVMFKTAPVDAWTVVIALSPAWYLIGFALQS